MEELVSRYGNLETINSQELELLILMRYNIRHLQEEIQLQEKESESQRL